MNEASMPVSGVILSKKTEANGGFINRSFPCLPTERQRIKAGETRPTRRHAFYFPVTKYIKYIDINPGFFKNPIKQRLAI
ncbi:MAG: hypothetical protein PHW13_00985 [Methylococcales bacterium]|nr:hypothetical protein [Methylococcales bacterium]